MDVYLVPIAADRFEAYYEAPDDDEPVESADGLGFFGRLRVRFQAQLKEAEQARHQVAPEEPTTFLGRMQKRSLRWIAERIAEQRLLWRLRTADAATLHVAADMDPQEAESLMRAAMKRDADRHLRLLAVHSRGADRCRRRWPSCPGPTCSATCSPSRWSATSWPGAARAAACTQVQWQVAPSTGAHRPAAGVCRWAAADRHRVIHDVAHRLHMPKLARFVERMAATGA